MADLLVAFALSSGMLLLLLGLVALARRIRRRGTAGAALAAAMAAYDEAMRSSAYDTFVEVQAQRDRSVPRAPRTGE